MNHVAFAIAYEALYQRYRHRLSYNFRRYLRRRLFVQWNLHVDQLCSYECCEGLL